MTTSPSPSPPLKVCIVGIGAIGGWLAGALHRAGCEVSALARGATLAAIRQQGLTYLSATAASAPIREQIPLRVSDQAAELGPQDLVIVAVKAPALAGVSAQVAPLFRPPGHAAPTRVLTAMNGVPWWFLQGFGGVWADRPLASVDADGRIAQAFARQPLIGGVVHCSCSTPSPGVVQHHFGNGLILGSPSGHNDAWLQALAQRLVAGGVQATLSAQIQKDVWYKLWGNMSINPVSAFTGATTDRILADPLVKEFVSAIMREAKAVGSRLGIQIDQEPADRHQVTLKLGAFKTSMLQDVEAGRAVEIDALVTAVHELGQLTATATPMTDALLGLARLHAQTRGLY